MYNITGGICLNHYWTIALELGVGFLALFIFTKILGKTQFSQITPFDFISALILGELIGNAIYDPKVSVWEIIFATTIWGGLILIATLLTQKMKSLRKLLEGEPSIIVHKGVLKYEAMKKSKIDINQILTLIRQNGYFAIEEVEYAILETNGMISVMPKPQYGNPNRSDMNIPPQENTLATAFILDGEVVWDNLREAEKDEIWLKKEMSKQNIVNYKDILYAEYQPNKPLYINKYENK
jgi:uncharacterized membrane protein YcaP (DUF421 family)